ncbi:S1 RNA-binding domain-containing protein [Actinomadura sp. WMMB 499]|uniref:S1 RNA-binding domain-containing protein n=1 Tax=Actinomadura sp. WMMB 499 TaxID=1219491 RepID=UPI0012442DD7|nr:S1 RNA-binding domain-containing protein [Actinomadura sp. WMMB 499]QFG24572.1 30S ribosomal protein S1 [Actinomadura sp. WMMB 499]
MDGRASVRVGETVTGTVVETGRQVKVRLDGDLAPAPAEIDSLDMSWTRRGEGAFRVGRRITAEVVSVNARDGRIGLSRASAEHPELWAFLKGKRRGDVLGGTVADIRNFGVFVALDEGPPHPVYPGVGFVTIPELSWRWFRSTSDVVRIGEHVEGEFLQFDTWNGEARLSLRALLPDPFQAFADETGTGQRFAGRVAKVVPFGVFVEVADGIEGLVHKDEPGAAALVGTVREGESLAVVVREVDRVRRRLLLGLG